MGDLRTSLYVAIRTAPKRVRNGLSDRNPTKGDHAASELTDIILKRVRTWMDDELSPEPKAAPSVGTHPKSKS